MYFAKYLPVEENLEKGNSYIRKSSPWNIYHNFKYSLQILDMQELQKVKLFLCSKDIKVGDRTNNGIIEKIEGNFSEEIWCIKDGIGKYHIKESTFKIIGEVSPEAVWVKEEMKFNDEDIAWISDDGDEELYFIDKDWDWKEFNTTNAMFAIKCPTCKQFH